MHGQQKSGVLDYMRVINLRFPEKLWKQMNKDKEYLELTWEDYIESLFSFQKELIEIFKNGTDHDLNKMLMAFRVRWNV